MQAIVLLMQREQRQCDQAQAALQRAEDAVRRVRQQRDGLLAHRGEYEAHWTAQFQQGASMDILLCYRSFMQRLEQAVLLQTRQVELADRQRTQARRELMECERRLASVRKLLQRRLAEAAQAGRQREQKQTDEQAQRMHWQAGGLGPPLPQ
jgi:flagellar FliJ protein